MIGYATLKSTLEFLFGPLGVQPMSSHIYGLYTAFVYLTPVFGGLIADRVLGQRRTVIIGAVLMGIGHFMMAFEQLFLLALLMLILGNGAFKPNISTQVGGLYAPGDLRRDRAFLIFYVGINIGAFLSPLVCGTLGEKVAWHYGFAAAGVGMAIALAIYLSALPTLPPDELDRRSGAAAPAAHRDEWRRIVALRCCSCRYRCSGRPTSSRATPSRSGPTPTPTAPSICCSGRQIPTTWFQSFNPFMIFAFTPFVIAWWA